MTHSKLQLYKDN